MRTLTSLTAVATALALSVTAAQAKTATPVSDMIGADGLAKTERHLAAIESPSADDRFALGGVHFLRAIEKSLQARYSVAAAQLFGVPILRLPVPPNPNPEPFHASLIADVFKTALDDFANVEAALKPIDGDVGVSIDLNALWFDINDNGIKDAGEAVFETAGATLGARPSSDDPLIVRFDTADVAWLRAYAHLLSGVSEVVLALDPTDAIETVQATAAKLGNAENSMLHDPDVVPLVDQGATILLALRQQPDENRTRAALAHFEAMTEQNMIFWQRVGEETDNTAEWIPNPQQTSAFGTKVSAEVADAWQAILQEGQAVLDGELLIPYWRSKDGYGINIRKVFEEPTPMDPVLWLQGAGALPYLQKGKVANSTTQMRFFMMLGGDAPLYAMWFN